MINTRLAFEEHPYATELATVAVEVGADAHPFVVLEDTLFYPEGGGQPCDHGSINGIGVLDVQRVDGRVLHYLAQPLGPGDAELRLDWQRRFDHMQQHTAQHLLSAVAADHFGWPTTSFHLGDQRSDIEVETRSISARELVELERLTLAEIRAAREVSTRRVDIGEYERLDVRTRGLPSNHSGDVRLVEIESVDLTTCGGTHLRSTAEIESMALGPTESLRGGTRLYWVAGGRVRRRLRRLEERNADLRRLLETSGEELIDATTAKLAALKDSTRALRRVTDELTLARASTLAASGSDFVEAHFDETDGGALRGLANVLLSQAPEKRALLTAEGPKGMFFLVVAGPQSGLDLTEVGPQVASTLDGRGGGSGNLFQGKAGSLDHRAEAVAQVESTRRQGA